MKTNSRYILVFIFKNYKIAINYYFHYSANFTLINCFTYLGSNYLFFWRSSNSFLTSVLVGDDYPFISFCNSSGIFDFVLNAIDVKEFIKS
jgi:hypothetical protein